MAPSTGTDPRIGELEGHRPYLVRFALAKLRDAVLAEEAVQEALLAALEGLPRFDGRSSLRTWLTAILRHKVTDAQRRIGEDRRHRDGAAGEEADDREAWLDGVFDDTGHWREGLRAWSDPGAAFEQRRFWEVLERCLDGLPAAGGRVFFRREVLGEDTAAICRDEGITESNCWVILHRARIALRGCLDIHWFGGEGARGG